MRVMFSRTVFIAFMTMALGITVNLSSADMTLFQKWNSIKTVSPGDLKEGWADDDAYIITGFGKPGPHAKTEREREALACEAALLTAQVAMIEKLADAGIANVKGSVTVIHQKEFMIKEIRGFIKGGTVIGHLYDGAKQVCYISYEMREKGLKKKVSDAVAKALSKSPTQ